MGHFHGSSHLLLTQFLHIEITYRVRDATCRNDLYPVGTVLNVVPNCRRDVVNTISEIWPTSKSLISGEDISITMTARHRDIIAR